MDFFDREAHARKQTRRLIWLFGLAVLVTVTLTNLALAVVIHAFKHPLFSGVWWNPITFLITLLDLCGEALVFPVDFLELIWNPYLFCWVTLISLTSVALGSLYKIRLLSAGGSAVAELLGGRCVETNTSDPDEQRLRNVVEEMAIASGTPVPEIYTLDNERGINAFSAGHTRDDVAIGVTRGCLKLLTRDELQGVIAHEFSHILNGDTRLNLRLMGLMHGLFWPTPVGRILVRGSTQAREIGESIFDADTTPFFLPTAPIGILFLIVGGISSPCVRLIKSLICRKREWLADAAAVQFTRNPAGVAGALKKIGGLYKQGRLDTPNAETASHLYFANSAYDSLFNFQSTHPPLARRVLAIDPAFDGQFPKVKALPPNQFERDQAYEQVVAKTIEAERKLPEAFVMGPGNITADCLKQAALMRFSIPPEVKQALRESAGAAGVIYSLLLSEDETVRAKQMEILRANLDPALLERTTKLASQIQVLGVKYKLMLAEFAVPALRQRSLDAYSAFNETVQRLIECDGAIELFEYALMKMVARQLRAYFEGPDLDQARYGRIQDVLPEYALLLSALAHVGQEGDEPAARKAFAQGQQSLDAPGDQIQFMPRKEWDLAGVDAALARLAKCPASVQRNVLLACGKTVAADDQVTEREAELLRAIADSLDCPMPPFVDAIRSEEMAQEA
ncbi:MAG: M48 family metalloprotease [Verrucomicrobiota bacterium]|jgi:Zn-dependent protease with chaperone function